MFLMKVFVFIVVPALIVYIFWVTYKFFNRTTPQEFSKEDIDNNSKIQLNNDEEYI